MTFGSMTEPAMLGGVLDARTLDGIRGLDIKQIQLTKEDSLLDAIFAGGVIVAFLPLPKQVGGPFDGQPTPDVDVDGDGLEIFCQADAPGSHKCAANPKGDNPVVDLCIDGDGTIVSDSDLGAGHQCTEATNGMNKDGSPKFRFVDGISVALTFRAVPVKFGNAPTP